MIGPIQMQHFLEPIGSRAVNLFMFAFSGGVYLDYLPAMYGYQAKPGCLHMSLEAAALAYMANEHHRKDLREMALQSYGAALSQTNHALQDLKPTMKLETATSVLLLALFAVISPQNSNEPQNIWSEHVRGALAILGSCGPEMFNSLSSQGILHHVISTVQIDCLDRRVKMPPQLKALYALSWLNPGPQVQLWSLVDRLAELTASIERTPTCLSDIEKIRDLDLSFEELMKSMPEAYSNCFEFEECPTTATHLSEGENIERIPVLKFASHRMAQRWNTLRLLRLRSIDLLTSATSAYLSSVPAGTHLDGDLELCLHNASETAKQITIEICATVPEHLRPDQFRRCDIMGVAESAWARSLGWPLSMAKATPHNSEALKNYIERQIRVIAGISSIHNLDIQRGSQAGSPFMDG
ncbi:hypothetical protein N7481_005121 [Penicillium waksmanii]|uniref:uncharacterized protein n=1 Tax=Penicillium waksmanii TaxID=69791 RepID=UPI00254689BC|nr:uncharacterized protein N7481_005121 [Penicillium waksmanii]KAJ5983022.1 hypothetical protein N7481_005121 [Penicillium waksmanii]